MDRLLNIPICTWTSATRKFKEHESNSEVHKMAVVMAGEFQKSMENKSIPVQQQLQQAVAKTIQENRGKLSSMLKTVIFCGRQKISLRGHKDDSQYFDGENNLGNFQKLLEFRVDSGDKMLESHLKTTSRNATYRSKTIQNELICCCGEYICDLIVEDIKISRYFTIMGDEATDCSNIEQLTVVIRYYSETYKEIKEEFLGFVACKDGVTGAAIARTIVEFITSLGLDMSYCRNDTVHYLCYPIIIYSIYAEDSAMTELVIWQ